MKVYTVDDLMSELSKYPAVTRVILDDPDTAWELPLHINFVDGTVYFSGIYSEAQGRIK